MEQRSALAFWMVPLLLVAGCGETHREAEREQQPTVSLASHFDSTMSGTIHGKVCWDGPLPEVPPFEIRSLVTAANPPQPRPLRDNPNAPKVDATTKAVAGAVVFLRKVEPASARPWDHPPVTIDHHERQLQIDQGDARAAVGFVRRGDAVAMVSHEKKFLNALHGDGAAYFTLMFPESEKPLSRVLKDKGIVELTSAAGYYWMRAYLFVDDHPYYTATDRKGLFELRQVPPGRYQLVCWMPNWHKKSEDRDPESGLVTRVHFGPAFELEREIEIERAGELHAEFAISPGMFVGGR
jgi:hypothetical protein